jgi:hypothetical protein
MEFSRSRLSDRLVMLSIAHHVSNDNGEAFPSVATIARECNISESQVHASLKNNRKTGELDFSVAASKYGTNIYRLPKFLDWFETIHPDAARLRARTSRRAAAPAGQGVQTLDRYRIEVQNAPLNSAPELSGTRAVTGAVAAPIDQAKYIEPRARRERIERPDHRILEISEKKQLPGAETSKKKQILATKGSDRYPSDPLRAELWDGIHRKKVFGAFFDARRLSPRQQVQDCIQAGVTLLMTNRVAKMKIVRAEDLAIAARKRLAEIEPALASIGDFDRRETETVAAVLHALVESAAEFLHRSGEPTLFALA